MSSESMQTEDAIKFHNLAVKIITGEENTLLRSIVKEKYKKDKKAFSIWEGSYGYENFFYAVIIPEKELLSWLVDLPRQNEIILFYDAYSGAKNVMFQFSDENKLKFILEEVSPSEFYLTDENTSYLLCFTHHNAMFAFGDAINWLKEKELKLKESHSSK